VIDVCQGGKKVWGWVVENRVCNDLVMVVVHLLWEVQVEVEFHARRWDPQRIHHNSYSVALLNCWGRGLAWAGRGVRWQQLWGVVALCLMVGAWGCGAGGVGFVLGGLVLVIGVGPVSGACVFAVLRKATSCVTRREAGEGVRVFSGCFGGWMKGAVKQSGEGVGSGMREW